MRRLPTALRSKVNCSRCLEHVRNLERLVVRVNTWAPNRAKVCPRCLARSDATKRQRDRGEYACQACVKRGHELYREMNREKYLAACKHYNVHRRGKSDLAIPASPEPS